MIRILGTIFAGLLGLAFGSFLNVCLSRWPAGESIVHPRSHCRQCGRTLAWWENVPLLSWLALRGRCRTCRAWIGWRYPLVELAVGGLWAISAWQVLRGLYLPGWPAVNICNSLIFVGGKMVLYWLLVALAVFDVEYLWLPDWLTLGGAAFGFALTLLRFVLYGTWISISPLPWAGGQETFRSHILGIVCKWLLGILVAPALILIIKWTYWIVRHRDGIGLGDAKLMLLLAVWLGLPQALLAFGLGVVLGALVAIVMLAVPSARRGSERWALSKLPLGTFLCIGGIVSGLWGGHILAAYQRWAGF
jgi:leader peptidase (prepilin peptidase)/N-methyltransferase